MKPARGYCVWGVIAGLLAVALGVSRASTLPGLAVIVNGTVATAVAIWGFRRPSPALLVLAALVLMNALLLGIAALSRPLQALPVLGGALVNAFVFLRGLAKAEAGEDEAFRILGWTMALPLLSVVVGLATVDPAWYVRAGGAATLVLAVAAAVARRPELRPSLGSPRRVVHWIWPVALVLPLAFLGERYILLLVHQYGPEILAQQALVLRAGAVERMIVAAAVVPVAEEVLFRGVIQGSLAERWGGPSAVLATSLLFALIHGQPAALPVLFTAGLVLGLARQVSGSLYPCILAHAVYNAFIVR